MEYPRSIYDPTGELYRGLTPSPIFLPRIRGILLLCGLLGMLAFNEAQGASLTHWTTAVGLLFNWAFAICWVIVAVALTFWRRPLWRWSAVTFAVFVFAIVWGLFTTAGTIAVTTDPVTQTRLAFMFALAAGLVLHIVNVHDGKLEQSDGRCQ